MKKFGKAAVTLPWLREFNEALINRPDVKDQKKISWDWLPQDWTVEPLFYDAVHWLDANVFKESSVPEAFHKVSSGLDEQEVAPHPFPHALQKYMAMETA